MRRTIFLLLLLLLSFAGSAQTDTLAPPVDSAYHNKVIAYYATYGLHPDSGKSPALYYEVFEWKGTHYHYGGHSKSGIDCSGFVSMLYGKIYNKTICGSALSLYNLCDTVPRAELKEGDMLFFRIRKGQVSHVGIYLGNNKFAHASVHSGVVIDDLDEPYYKKYFYRGGRLKQ